MLNLVREIYAAGRIECQTTDWALVKARVVMVHLREPEDVSITPIRNVQVAAVIYSNSGRIDQVGIGAWPAGSGAGHRGNDAVRSNFSDTGVKVIRDIQAAVRVEGYSLRHIQLCISCQTSIAGKAANPVPRNRQ